MTRLDITDVARRLAGNNRWLLTSVATLLVVATILPSTTGAGRAQGLLDLATRPPSDGTAVVPLEPNPAPPGFVPTAGATPPPAGAGTPSGAMAEELAPAPDAPTAGPSAAQPCASAAVVDAVVAAQRNIEAGTGQPLPIDVAQLFANVAGCGAGGNPLDALGVVGQLLHLLGIERIPLPSLPDLPFPPPPPGLDELGPTVLPVCAEVIQQLVTVAALAPFARLDTREVVALFDPVVAVCSLFAPTA